MLNATFTVKERKKIPVKKTPMKSVPAVVEVAPKKVFAKKSGPAEPTNTHDISKVNGKIKKEKLIRDSFAIPESEYKQLSDVKRACLNAAVDAKKSELIRVAIAQLSQMSMAKLSAALNDLTKIQAGRPKK